MRRQRTNKSGSECQEVSYKEFRKLQDDGWYFINCDQGRYKMLHHDDDHIKRMKNRRIKMVCM